MCPVDARPGIPSDRPPLDSRGPDIICPSRPYTGLMSASAVTVLIGVAALLLAAGAVAALVAGRRRGDLVTREASGRLDALLAEAARGREASQSVDRRFDEL